ncbi:carph-isopro domain-containing protein [Azospirillum sp. TSA2s]|uniref:carph-isopro domain-containing protein n=1 Tax=Azospirillum sp. TSA2s TaxID=709810 RepID=UPI003529A1F7
MTQAEHIISKFGGVSALSRKLGHRHPTTVDGWRRRGWIPADQQPRVLAAGQGLDPPITPADFFAAAAIRTNEAA